MRRNVSSRRFYRLLILISTILFLIEWVPNALTVKEKRINALDAIQTKQIDTYVAMTQLLISLATASSGVLIAIVFNRYQKEPLPRAQAQRAMTAWALLGISLYAGHLSYQNLLRMLDASYFNIFQARIVWPSRLQFWAFVGSIAVVADFVFVSFRKEYES
jgi:hypothetical protein